MTESLSELEFLVCECGCDRFYTATTITVSGREARWQDVEVCESCGCASEAMFDTTPRRLGAAEAAGA